MKFAIAMVSIIGIGPILTAGIFQYLGSPDTGWIVSFILMLITLHTLTAWAMRRGIARPPCSTKPSQDSDIAFFL